MKRAPALQPLSREHHHGLVAARRLRLAAEGRGSLREAVVAFLAAWAAEIEPHFRSEEELLFPAYARAVAEPGAAPPLLRRALEEHAALRRSSAALAETAGVEARAAAELARALEAHIRFEERLLFPAIEAALDPQDLEALTGPIEAASAGRACRPNPPEPNQRP